VGDKADEMRGRNAIICRCFSRIFC